MNELALADALALAERHPVFVATADSAATLAKVTENPRVSVRENTWRSG
ncbi:MAG: hypothetical protein R6V05_06695 [Candidatus Brocadiia bacterium]